MIQCSEPDCQNPAASFGALPGHPTRFICADHQGDTTGFISADGALVAHYQPLESYVSPEAVAAPEGPLCTFLADGNPKHKAPAVLAFQFKEVPNAHPSVHEPGLTCVSCLKQLVRASCNGHWNLELSDLP